MRPDHGKLDGMGLGTGIPAAATTTDATADARIGMGRATAPVPPDFPAGEDGRAARTAVETPAPETPVLETSVVEGPVPGALLPETEGRRSAVPNGPELRAPARRAGVREIRARVLKVGSAILVLGSLAVVGVDIATATESGAMMHQTISQAGLTRWAPLFRGAVMAIVLGGSAVLATAIGLRRDRPAQAWAGALLGAVAMAGFVLVALFTKQDWSQPPTVSGTVHRLGGLVAFVTLPVAVIVLARRARAARGVAVAAIVAALVGLASFLPIVIAIAAFGISGGWWLRVPLGLVERCIAAGDIAGLLLLALLSARALRAMPRRPPQPRTDFSAPRPRRSRAVTASPDAEPRHTRTKDG